MLAGQGLALGLNLGVAPSAFLMPPEAVQWLAETSGTDPDVSVGRIEEVRPPAGLPEAVVANVDAKLARAEGLARSAYLAAVTYKQGERGHILAIVDPIEGAEAPLATEISEALRFSGNVVGSLDVVFVRSHDPIAARLARVGLKFELPEAQSKSGPAAPGFDPDAPPRLK